jgi:hypothetical protein
MLATIHLKIYYFPFFLYINIIKVQRTIKPQEPVLCVSVKLGLLSQGKGTD